MNMVLRKSANFPIIDAMSVTNTLRQIQLSVLNQTPLKGHMEN